MVFERTQSRLVIKCSFQAHVCIQQTVIDLLKCGYQVHVVADATSSRSQMDRCFAFEVNMNRH